MREVNEKQLKKIVRKHRLVIVDCWAPWCRFCVYFDPILEDISRKYKGMFFAKLDLGENKEVAKTFKIMGIPTLLIFKEGKLVEKLTGVLPRRKLEPMLVKWLEDGKKE